jgi:putative transposase
MSSPKLRDDQWERMLGFLKTRSHVYIRNELECRLFIEAVSWVLCNGAHWRMLPARFGNWNSVYKRFNRWCAFAVLDDIRQHFANDPDIYQILPVNEHLRIRKKKRLMDRSLYG